MREEYMAPDLYFESFVLSESIASCTSYLIATTQMLLDQGHFTSGSGYTCTNGEPTGYENYCYWSGSSNVLFTS